MSKNIRVTRENLSKYTRGMEIRLRVGDVHVAVPKKSIVELFDLYGNECSVYFSQSIRDYVYFYIVMNDRPDTKSPEPNRLNLPF